MFQKHVPEGAEDPFPGAQLARPVQALRNHEVAAAMRDAVQPVICLCQDNWCQVYLLGHHNKCYFSDLDGHCHSTMSKDQLA